MSWIWHLDVLHLPVDGTGNFQVTVSNSETKDWGLVITIKPPGKVITNFTYQWLSLD